jgi:hypothetical protein
MSHISWKSINWSNHWSGTHRQHDHLKMIHLQFLVSFLQRWNNLKEHVSCSFSPEQHGINFSKDQHEFNVRLGGVTDRHEILLTISSKRIPYRILSNPLSSWWLKCANGKHYLPIVCSLYAVHPQNTQTCVYMTEAAAWWQFRVTNERVVWMAGACVHKTGSVHNGEVHTISIQ